MSSSKQTTKYNLLAVTTALVMYVAGANAVVVNFDTCHSSCDNIGVLQNDVVETLATLDFSDNGVGGVDFVLTNTISNRYAGDTSSFVSELFFGGPMATSISSFSPNIDSVSHDAGGSVNAGLSFNWDFNFANSGGPNSLRIVNGGTAFWTLDGFSAADFAVPAMVHFQALSTNGESVKIIGTPGVTAVPEPTTFGLLGLGLLGLTLRRQRG